MLMRSERFILPVLLFSAIFLVSGCASSRSTDVLARYDLPKGGEPLSEDLAADMEKFPRGIPVVREDTTNWVLPAISRKYRFEVFPETGEAVASHYSMIALGIPYAYMPLSFSFSRYEYAAGQRETTGEVTRRYIPFWSWDDTEGDPSPELQVDVNASPLLYEWGTEAGPQWYFEDFSTSMDKRMEFSFGSALWYLGPVWFDSDTISENDKGEPVVEKGKYFFPLFLGRGPGALLWMSRIEQTQIAGNRVTESTGHGPLAGYSLWYGRDTVAGINADDHLRLLLGGLLWYDAASGRVESPERDRVTGPLWGLFGGGMKDGEPTVYLFRVPVKL